MTHKCLLDSATKIVVNVIELEDGADWVPFGGMELAPQHDGGIGDTWDGAKFVRPVAEALVEELNSTEGQAPDVIG